MPWEQLSVHPSRCVFGFPHWESPMRTLHYFSIFLKRVKNRRKRCLIFLPAVTYLKQSWCKHADVRVFIKFTAEWARAERENCTNNTFRFLIFSSYSHRSVFKKCCFWSLINNKYVDWAHWLFPAVSVLFGSLLQASWQFIDFMISAACKPCITPVVKRGSTYLWMKWSNGRLGWKF